jgi:hypothetical protein
VMPFWEALTHAGGWLCSVCVGGGSVLRQQAWIAATQQQPLPPSAPPTHTHGLF